MEGGKGMNGFIWMFYLVIGIYTDRVSKSTVMHIEAHKQYDDMPCLFPQETTFPFEVSGQTGIFHATDISLNLDSKMIHIRAYGEMSAWDVKWMFEKNGWHFPDENEKKLEKIIALGQEEYDRLDKEIEVMKDPRSHDPSDVDTAQVKSALGELLSIVEDEFKHDPEPEDLPSWRRALENGNEALEILNRGDYTVKGLKRMWVNQPSTLQADHRHHGARVLVDFSDTTFEHSVRCWFTSGKVVSSQINRQALSPGWPAEKEKPTDEES
jgi:hypothetical protein